MPTDQYTAARNLAKRLEKLKQDRADAIAEAPPGAVQMLFAQGLVSEAESASVTEAPESD